MYWPKEAKKRNLKDAKWLLRVKWLSKEDIESRWPDAEINPAATPWGDDTQPDRITQILHFCIGRTAATGSTRKQGSFV